MEQVEFVVVGAGLAGLATAWTLAKGGAEVMVVERGDYPGAKNVTGGRLYLGPVRELCGELLAGAPFERRVAKERVTAMGPRASTTVELHSQRWANPAYESYTLVRGTFDQWLADKAAEAGALIVPGYKVDGLVKEAGRISGISAAGDAIGARVVVAADGALSFLAQEAGLRPQRDPHHFAVGFKEVRSLDADKIEARCGLLPGEGLAQLYFGALTGGVPGGGFLYTNRESISLGMVVNLEPLMRADPPRSPHELFEAFKARPEVAPLLEGTHPLEYSAHSVPEGGMAAMPELVTEGLVLVGDGAGLGLNLGLMVRGMDLALVSGVLAGRTLLKCRERNDFSAAALGAYPRQLWDHPLGQEMKTFRHYPALLANPRLFTAYPELACKVMERMMAVGPRPKVRLTPTLLRTAWPLLKHPSTWGDLFRWMVRA